LRTRVPLHPWGTMFPPSLQAAFQLSFRVYRFAGESHPQLEAQVGPTSVCRTHSRPRPRSVGTARTGNLGNFHLGNFHTDASCAAVNTAAGLVDSTTRGPPCAGRRAQRPAMLH
jgi:hypothetical protein